MLTRPDGSVLPTDIGVLPPFSCPARNGVLVTSFFPFPCCLPTSLPCVIPLPSSCPAMQSSGAPPTHSPDPAGRTCTASPSPFIPNRADFSQIAAPSTSSLGGRREIFCLAIGAGSGKARCRRLAGFAGDVEVTTSPLPLSSFLGHVVIPSACQVHGWEFTSQCGRCTVPFLQNSKSIPANALQTWRLSVFLPVCVCLLDAQQQSGGFIDWPGDGMGCYRTMREQTQHLAVIAHRAAHSLVQPRAVGRRRG